jgi:hypothetical protein
VRAKVEQVLQNKVLVGVQDPWTVSDILTDAFFAALDEMAAQAQERGASGILIPIPSGESDG